MNLKDYSFVVSGSFRKKVFLELKNKKTPSQIAQNLKASTTQVSRALKQLKKRNLVECLTPEAKKGKLFSLTNKGKELFSEMDLKD